MGRRPFGQPDRHQRHCSRRKTTHQPMFTVLDEFAMVLSMTLSRVIAFLVLRERYRCIPQNQS